MASRSPVSSSAAGWSASACGAIGSSNGGVTSGTRLGLALRRRRYPKRTSKSGETRDAGSLQVSIGAAPSAPARRGAVGFAQGWSVASTRVGLRRVSIHVTGWAILTFLSLKRSPVSSATTALICCSVCCARRCHERSWVRTPRLLDVGAIGHVHGIVDHLLDESGALHFAGHVDHRLLELRQLYQLVHGPHNLRRPLHAPGSADQRGLRLQLHGHRVELSLALVHAWQHLKP